MIQNNKRNYLKERGITLIALVITIVVLLILAAVSINAMFGENGLLANARKSINITKIEQYKEELSLYILGQRAEDKDFDATTINVNEVAGVQIKNGKEENIDGIRTIIKSMPESDSKFYVIENGKLKGRLTDDMTYEERKKLVKEATDAGIEYVDETTSNNPDNLPEEQPKYKVTIVYKTEDDKEVKKDKITVAHGETTTIDVTDKGYIIKGWELYDDTYEQKDSGRIIDSLEGLNNQKTEISIDCDTYIVVTCEKPTITIKYIKKESGREIKAEEKREYSFKDTFVFSKSSYNIDGYEMKESYIQYLDETKETLADGQSIELWESIAIVNRYESTTKYTINIEYVDSNNTEIKDKTQITIEKGSVYTITPANIKGYAASGKITAKDVDGNDIVIQGSEITPTSDVTITIYYNQDKGEEVKAKYTINVSHKDENGNTITTEKYTAEEGKSKISIKDILGYKYKSISGKYSDGTTIVFNDVSFNLTQNANITVIYNTCNIYTVTVKHYDADTNSEIGSTSKQYNEGKILAINKLKEKLTGYSFEKGKIDGEVITNINIDSDKTVSLYYKKNITITIKYICSDGDEDEEIKTEEKETYKVDSRYGLTIPEIEGYKVVGPLGTYADKSAVDIKRSDNSSYYFITKNDCTITIYYTKGDSEEIAGGKKERLVTVYLNPSKYKVKDNVKVIHLNGKTGQEEELGIYSVTSKYTISFYMNSYSKVIYINLGQPTVDKTVYPNVSTSTIPTLLSANNDANIILGEEGQVDEKSRVAVKQVTEASINKQILKGATEKADTEEGILFNISNYSKSAETYILKLGIQNQYEGKMAILKYRTNEGQWVKMLSQIVSDSQITFSINNWANYYYLTFAEATEEIKASSVYATLYTDGTLAFSNDNSTISGKTVLTKYGNIADIELGKNYELYHPWLNDYGITSLKGLDWDDETAQIKKAITNVTFVNKVSLKSTAYLFAELRGITQINNLNYLDTSNVADMSYMFANCESLENIDFNVLNTSKVTNMRNLFESCENAKKINMSGVNTQNVRNMAGMFGGCLSLENLELSSFNTSRVTDMSTMFCLMKAFLDLSKFDTKNVTNMTAMFSGYMGTYLDLTSFNTSKVTDFHNMFHGSKFLKHIIVDSGWKVSSKADVNNMFLECGTGNVVQKGSVDTTIALNAYGFSYNHVYTELGDGATGFLFKPDKTMILFSKGADQTVYLKRELSVNRIYWDVQNGKVVAIIEKTEGDPIVLPIEISNNGKTIKTINPLTQKQAEYRITLENYHEVYTGKKYNITMSGYAGQYIIVNSDNTITLSSGLEQAGAVATYLGQGCMIITLGSNTVYIATSIDGTKLLSTDGTIGAELEN